MKSMPLPTWLAATVVALTTSSASAHFIYIIPPEPGDSQVQVVFGEGAEPDDNNKMLSYLAGIELTNGGDKAVMLSEGDGALVGTGSDTQVFTTTKSLGVMSRGGAPFLLEYYAKGGPTADQWSWQSDSGLRLDIVPERKDNGDIELSVTFDGKPAAGVEVVYETANDADAVDTNDKGVVILSDVATGLASIRAKFVEDDQSGELDGKAYESVKHYSTLTLRVQGAIEQEAIAIRGSKTNYPDLPREITSFGAAILDRTVYVYGGHTGSAHAYSKAEQANELWSLNLDEADAIWQTRATGPHLQGNALVAAAGKVVLLGGFTAMNDEGEEHDLRSQSNVRAFDPATNEWSDLPSLPEPRSSFDAVVMNDTIYVAGGWSMQHEADSVWHDTAWKLDLSSSAPSWQPLASVPFQRRALALAAFEGKVFTIGGMSMSDGPTTNVSVFDTTSDSWTAGPNLQGVTMNGFGCAAFATGGRLYATTYDGMVQRLSEDGSKWEIVGEMPKKRFFHRLIPASDRELLIFGGGDMSVGKYPDVERLEILETPVTTTASNNR